MQKWFDCFEKQWKWKNNISHQFFLIATAKAKNKAWNMHSWTAKENQTELPIDNFLQICPIISSRDKSQYISNMAIAF